MPLLFLSLVILIITLFVIDGIRLQITPNPTTRKVRSTLKEILPRGIQGSIIDLGSGFGSLSYFLSKEYPNQSVIGLEKALIPYSLSKLIFFKRKNLKLKYENIFDCDISKAGFIYCYLSNKHMPKLEKKLLKEAKGYVISHTFALPNVKPVKVIYAQDIYKSPVYLYKFLSNTL